MCNECLERIFNPSPRGHHADCLLSATEKQYQKRSATGEFASTGAMGSASAGASCEGLGATTGARRRPRPGRERSGRVRFLQMFARETCSVQQREIVGIEVFLPRQRFQYLRLAGTRFPI